jgi:hypothetical protein
VEPLHLELHFACDLAQDGGPIDHLQESLRARGFGDSVRVLEYERDRSATDVDLAIPGALLRAVVDKGTRRGPHFDELSAQSPPRFPRRFGETMIRGRLPRTWLKVRFDEYVPAMPSGDRWLFSNSVTVNLGAERVRGVGSADWLRALLADLASEPNVLWGAAFDAHEFAASNLHDDAKGMWALGRDVRRSLPGLFWLNVFGAAYIQAIGRNVLLATPAQVAEFSSGVSVELYSSPEQWNSDQAKRVREESLDHLGREFFFDRNHPTRLTRAPDFGLPEVRDGERLQVVTRDGIHFTVVPQYDET